MPRSGHSSLQKPSIPDYLFLHLMSAHFVARLCGVRLHSGCTVLSDMTCRRLASGLRSHRIRIALRCIALPCLALPCEYNRGSEAPRYFWGQVRVITKDPTWTILYILHLRPPHDKALPMQHTSLVTATTCEWVPSILDGRSYNCQQPAAVRAMDAVVTFRWCIPPCGATCMQVMRIPPSWIRYLSRCD